MKNKIKILMVLALCALLLPTCQKDPDLRMPDLQEGVAPLILKNTDFDQTLDIFNLSAFNASIDVDTYFETLPQSMTVMISMNDDYENKAVLRDNVTSFPTAISFTAADLVNLLPGLDSINQLQPGDFFRVYAVTTLKDGTVIDGLDTLYNAYGDGIANLPGSSLAVAYTVVCPYDQEFAVGDYIAYSSPSQWNATGPVTITADPEDPYTVYLVGMAAIEGNVEDGDPIPLHINPITYVVTADPTVIATDYFGYTNGTFGGKGEYDACEGKYTIRFRISVLQGNFGTYEFILTKAD